MMLEKLIENDCRECMLMPVDCRDRNIWRSGVRSAMPAASQLFGGLGPLMWMMLLHLHVNHKHDNDLSYLKIYQENT